MLRGHTNLNFEHVVSRAQARLLNPNRFFYTHNFALKPFDKLLELSDRQSRQVASDFIAVRLLRRGLFQFHGAVSFIQFLFPRVEAAGKCSYVTANPKHIPWPAMIPNEMTAIEIVEPGAPDVLQPKQIAMPEPKAGELLVKVAAAGINRPDVLQRKGLYPPPKGASPIPGLEIAGEVVATGPDTKRFSVGDTVTALVNGGGYAEYCIAEEPAALPVPAGLDLVHAAAIPETFFTVWSNVFDRGGLAEGDWLLIHGGSSGIGTTAIQLGKAFGAHVLATAGSAEKCAACEKLGAVKAINYRDEDFTDIVKSESNGHGADVILDMVGGDYIERNFKAAAPDARIVQIGFLGGPKAKVDFTRLMLKRLVFTGSTLRSRPLAVKGEIAAALEAKVWPLLAEGSVAPVMDTTFPLADAAEAHRRMESSAHIGKIVLTV